MNPVSRTVLALVLLAPTAAVAQTSFDVLAEGIVVADATYPDGVGAPTVVWNADSAQFVMFFEARVEELGCTEAWVIASATSPDGYVWTPGREVVSPLAGTAHACGGRRPAAMIDDDTGIRYLAFNVVDEVREDQVALLQVDNGQQSVRILPELDGLVAPTLAKYEDEWVMLGVAADQSIRAGRSTDTITWSLDTEEAIPTGATPWAIDGTLSPTLLCNDASSYEWEMYYGGWTADETAWTWGVSDDASSWYITAELDTWTGDAAWESWEALKVGTATVVFYEDLDDLGLPRIGLAATSPTWTPADAKSRRCVNPN